VTDHLERALVQIT
jgi:hypothetical protein